MKKADILAASEKLGIPTSSIVDAIFDELWSELSQENITFERTREILEISHYASAGEDNLASKAISVEIKILYAQLSAATTLTSLRDAETKCLIALGNELHGKDSAGSLWEIGGQRYNEIGKKLLEESRDSIPDLLKIRRMMFDTRFGTTAAREAIDSRIEELLQAELAGPTIAAVRAREIYDSQYSSYKTKKMAIKVLLRLLPN